jgi:hypothetical protein
MKKMKTLHVSDVEALKVEVRGIRDLVSYLSPRCSPLPLYI